MGRMGRTPRTTSSKTSVAKNPFKLPAGKPLKRDDFKHDWDLKLTLPVLVLAIPVLDWAFKEGDYKAYRFAPGRQWIKLAHQTAGLACHQHYMHATILTPKSVAVAQGMNELAAKWEDSQVGCFGGPTIDGLLDYRADLKRLFGADCNHSHRDFEEAIYPIDIEDLPKLTDEPMPKNRDDLIVWKDGWQRAMGCINRFRLYILGPNSD